MPPPKEYRVFARAMLRKFGSVLSHPSQVSMLPRLMLRRRRLALTVITRSFVQHRSVIQFQFFQQVLHQHSWNLIPSCRMCPTMWCTKKYRGWIQTFSWIYWTALGSHAFKFLRYQNFTIAPLLPPFHFNHSQPEWITAGGVGFSQSFVVLNVVNLWMTSYGPIITSKTQETSLSVNHSRNAEASKEKEYRNYWGG